MTESYGRSIGKERNDLARSMGALLGITQGLLCDGELNDREIRFLHNWLRENGSIASTPPASIIFQRVSAILEDGVITAAERQYLSETLQRFVGGPSESLAKPVHVMELGFDNIERITFANSMFCLTGEFAYAERGHCENLIAAQGGIIGNVTKKLNYLIVGERGSTEWKHGSFGTKVAKALAYKERGSPILIVAENAWASCLRAQ